MTVRCSAKALARAVRRDLLDCDSAIQSLLNAYTGPLAVPSLPKAWLALGWHNMGWLGLSLDLPDGPMKVARIIEEFGLAPFLPLFDRHERACFAKGEIVLHRGEPFRVVGSRKVTPFALCRPDGCELLIESLDGRAFGFVDESEVEQPDG